MTHTAEDLRQTLEQLESLSERLQARAEGAGVLLDAWSRERQPAQRVALIASAGRLQELSELLAEQTRGLLAGLVSGGEGARQDG
ncbi:MAG: hypothetical protein H6741_30820 [Alphaproteobacteria bacterium]|nr:hypothetical protein [Alphaproteobacteria bacterium]